MRAYSKDHRVRPPVNLAMIVFVARGLSEDDANKMEMGLIARHGRIDKGTGCLRNLTDGGEGWKNPHESGRAAISRHFKGCKLSDAHREKLRQAKLGKKQSPEIVRRRAESNTGKRRTQETRERMSAAQKGHSVSAEQRAKLSEFFKGKSLSKDHRMKISVSQLKRAAIRRLAGMGRTGRTPWELF